MPLLLRPRRPTARVVRFPNGPHLFHRYTGQVMSRQPAAPLRPAEPFRLGEWLVHPDRNELVRRGESRRLETRTMDLLVHLAAHAGAVVSKDELVDAVWESRIISEGTLTNAVAELRRALGDDTRAPRYIATIRKRGYRLVAEVSAADPTGAAPRIRRRPAGSRRQILAAAAVLTLVVGSILVLSTHRASSLDPERVLVLPVVNRTGDPANDPLSLLVRDRIVREAAAAGLGRFTAGETSAATGDAAVGAGRDAGAGLVVMGSSYLRDGAVELQLQLVDAAAGELLYMVPPVATTQGAAAAAADLVQHTLGIVATHLHAHAHYGLLSHPPPFAAHREFAVGSSYFGTDFGRAIEHFRRAVEIDPEFTSAWLRLASAYRNLGRYAEAEATFAQLELRRDRMTPFEQLSTDLIARFNTDPRTAYAAGLEIERMLPGDPVFRMLTAGLALRLNRPRESLECLERDPWSAPFHPRHVMWSVAHITRTSALHMLGRYEAEARAARTGLATHPGVLHLRAAEARAAAALGDDTGVRQAVDAALIVQPVWGSAGLVMLESAATAATHGRPSLARELIDRAVEWFEAQPPSARTRLHLAEALLRRGDLARSRAALEDLVSAPSGQASSLDLMAWGWLGIVAARQGDGARAAAADAALEAVSEPLLRSESLLWRAAVAAWQGHHEEALHRLRNACAAGWGGYPDLHDRHRLLLEPITDRAEVANILQPVG